MQPDHGSLWRYPQRTGGKVIPVKLDLDAPSGYSEELGGARVVVACAEPADAAEAAFAEEVLGRGIHYVDVSASDTYLRQVERLDPLAKRSGATAALSAGLLPGMTNLLARHCSDVLDDVPREPHAARNLHSIDVSVMLGLGERHGEAAVRWTVENLDKRFRVPGLSDPVESLTDPKRVILHGGYGTRAAYRFDLADQHVLARTLGAERPLMRPLSFQGSFPAFPEASVR